MPQSFDDVRIFIGPMSKNIVDSVIDFSEKNNLRLGLIPSRRQIEYSGGYVNSWKTDEFIQYVRGLTDNVVLQRDHAGRGQGDLGRSDHFSLANDAYYGFDLIHIDPWKKYIDLDEMVKETASNIRFCNKLNKDCSYEVGTEEAIHKYTHEELDYFLFNLKSNLGPLWKKVVYAVIQAGTKIVGTENVGVFDQDRCREMIRVCRKYGLLSKEHNGDYLTPEEIRIRFATGLDGLNIAPEFGVFETKTILDNITVDPLREQFFRLCHDSRRWVKWLPEEYLAETLTPAQKKRIMEVSGHYVFANPEFKEMKNRIANLDLQIKKQISLLIEEKVRNEDIH